MVLKQMNELQFGAFCWIQQRLLTIEVKRPVTNQIFQNVYSERQVDSHHGSVAPLNIPDGAFKKTNLHPMKPAN